MSAQRTARQHAAERGDIISRWLLQLLAIMAVVALIAYELVAVGVAAVTADDVAREVARATRDAYRTEPSLERAEATAQEVAQTRDATLVAVEEDGDVLSVTLEKRAGTLVVHRIGPMVDLVTPAATSRIRVR